MGKGIALKCCACSAKISIMFKDPIKTENALIDYYRSLGNIDADGINEVSLSEVLQISHEACDDEEIEMI